MDNKQITMGLTTVAERAIHVESINSLLYLEFNEKFSSGVDSHPAWEIIYADKGRCMLIIDDGDPFTLEQGEMYFHKPYERHVLKVFPNEYPNILVCSFFCSSESMRFFEGRRLKTSSAIKKYISTMIHEASLTFDDSDKFLKIHGAMFSKNKLWAGEQSILLRLELMLIELIRENELAAPQKKLFISRELSNDPLCSEIIEYLEDRIYDTINIKELCKSFSFSQSYLSRYFIKVSGYTIVQYFNMLKVEEAKLLIRRTHMSFFEISERLMLSNSHYFSTLFKKYVGMTPTEYKKSCK